MVAVNECEWVQQVVGRCQAKLTGRRDKEFRGGGRDKGGWMTLKENKSQETEEKRKQMKWDRKQMGKVKERGQEVEEQDVKKAVKSRDKNKEKRTGEKD